MKPIYLYYIFILSFLNQNLFAQNLVLNPNFDDHSNEDVRDPNGNWKLNKIEWEKVGDGGAHAMENIGVDNSTAFIFKKDNSSQQINDITLRQDIPITEGELYQFSFTAKMEQDTGNLLRFSIVKIKNGQVANEFWNKDTLLTEDYVDWHTHQGTFEIPAGSNTDTIRIIFYRGKGGDTCLLDQVIVKKREKETYYVSSTQGNDNNAGTSPAEAWASLQKISNNKFIKGDSILFKSGDEFIGQLAVPSSGSATDPIVFSKYGEGSKPIINGSGGPDGDFEFAVFIENQEGIVLDNLEIQNDRKTPRTDNKDTRCYGVLIRVNQPESKEYFRLQNLTIKNIYPIHLDDIDFQNTEVAGIHVLTTINYPDKEKHIKDIVIENCEISRSAKFGVWMVHGLAVNDTVGNDSINRNMNIVVRNNHVFENGGSGVTISKAYNCLIEHNLIEYSGASSFDSRMLGRGSSIWFFNSINGVSQYNTLTHVRGEIDSYSQHIDFSNKNIFMQYNYCEDNEGGFVQVLGDNHKSVYRYNISVNDGWRTTSHKGRTIGLTDYANQKRIRSDSTYIYGNTVIVNKDISTQIFLDGFSTFIYNNIFYADGNGEIGSLTEIIDRSKDYMHISNNLYYGKSSSVFQEVDPKKVTASPYFVGPGRDEPDHFKLSNITNAAYKGLVFDEPQFDMAGKGIFKEVTAYPKYDFFNNTIDMTANNPHIGAHAGGNEFDPPSANIVNEITLKGNPVSTVILADLPSAYLDKDLTVQIVALNGTVAQQETVVVASGTSLIITPASSIRNGMYLLVIKSQNNSTTTPFIIIR